MDILFIVIPVMLYFLIGYFYKKIKNFNRDKIIDFPIDSNEMEKNIKELTQAFIDQDYTVIKPLKNHKSLIMEAFMKAFETNTQILDKLLQFCNNHNIPFNYNDLYEKIAWFSIEKEKFQLFKDLLKRDEFIYHLNYQAKKYDPYNYRRLNSDDYLSSLYLRKRQMEDKLILINEIMPIIEKNTYMSKKS